MKRLNSKGITTVEVLVCFVLVVIITLSMYQTISFYNEKRILEGYKQKIYSYKYELTQEIQSDLIRIGLVDANIDKKIEGSKITYTVDMVLRDSTKRRLVIEQTLTKSDYHPSGSTSVDDAFMIKYGPPSDLIERPLPNLGSYKVKDTGKTAQDFSINNVLIEKIDDRVLSIYIGFYHPDFGTRYAIDITTPVDFIFSD